MDRLILELNDPANQGAPERIHEIERQIQALQREKSSWQLGLDLLHHQQATVRFYGALTLNIKINIDWYVNGPTTTSWRPLIHTLSGITMG